MPPAALVLAGIIINSTEEHQRALLTSCCNFAGDIASFDSKWKGNRIEFLARVRNWSIRPLFGQKRKYHKVSHAPRSSFKRAWRRPSPIPGVVLYGAIQRRFVASLARRTASTSYSWTSRLHFDGPPVDLLFRSRSRLHRLLTAQVILMNDAFYCAEDMLRLILHK